MKHIHLLIIIIFIFFSCTEEYVNLQPEEKDNGLPPESFELTIKKVTDSEISLEWSTATDPDGENISYEVSLNDSIIIYDLNYNNYLIENLIPDTEYKIGVNAVDNSFNKSSVYLNVTTKEQLIMDYFHFDLGFYFDYNFTKAIKTKDNGVLIAGRKHESHGIQFLVKLSSNFKIQWVKEYNWNYMDYIIDLIELNDNNYLILRKESLTKVDTQGDQIWKYSNENNSTITTINSGYETENGELIITGTTDINRDLNENINLEGFISKISSSGNLIWHKYFGKTYKNRAEKIIEKHNGNILIAGTATYKFPDNMYTQNCLWLIETDINGELLLDSIISNKYSGSDLIKDIFIGHENDVLICGGIWATMQDGYYDFVPRFLKINSHNDITWEYYPEITGLGYFSTYDGMVSYMTNEFTFFSNLDRGVYIGTVNTSREITWDLKLRDFPPALFITYTNSENIAFFTMNGELIVINPNGYNE